MLIERWERLRGVDQWPEVQATITSEKWRTTASRSGRVWTHLASVDVKYQSPDGLLRSRRIRFARSLNYLDTGDWFYIRCNPADPSKIYVRQSAQGKFLVISAALTPAILIWVRARSH